MRHSRATTSVIRTSTGLVLASVVNGTLAYALAVAASRWLDDAGFASFGVAWSLWALSVAVLIFPLQHWIAWRVAIDGGVGSVRMARTRISMLLAALIGVMAILGGVDRLFPEPGAWSVSLAVVGLASAGLGIGRGLLVARERLGAVAGVISLENVLRLSALVAILALGGGAAVAVLSLAAGALALLPWVGRSPRLREGRRKRVRVLRELGALAGAAGIAQVLVQFAPAAAALTGSDSEEVAAVFATFALTRAPVLVALAVSTQLTVPLSRAIESGRLQLRHIALRSAIASCVLMASAFALGWTIVPTVVEWFFGPGRSLDAIDSAFVTSGMALAIVGIGAIIVMLAGKQTGTALIAWGTALVTGVGAIAAGATIPVAFLTAEAVGVLGSLAHVWWTGAPKTGSQGNASDITPIR